MTTATSMGECTPGVSEDCYSGPPETQDVGVCHAGTRECKEDGTFGPCFDQQTPLTEQCQTPEDENCSGVTEPCAPGTVFYAKAWVPSTGEALLIDLKRDDAGDVHVVGRTGSNGIVDLGNGLVADNESFIVQIDAAGDALTLEPWTSRGNLTLSASPPDVLLGSKGEAGLLNIPSTWPARAYETSYGGSEVAEWVIGNALGVPSGPDSCHSFIYQTQRGSTTEDLFVGGLYRYSVEIGGQTLTTSDDEHDLMIARLTDTAGTSSYVSTIQVGRTAAGAIALTPDGDVVMLAHVTAPVSYEGMPIEATGNGYLLAKFEGEDGSLMWTRWIPTNVGTNILCAAPLHQLKVLSDGGVVAHLRGAVTVDGQDYPGVFSAVRFDPSGNALWVHPVANAIAETPNFGFVGLYPTDSAVYWIGDVNGLLDYGNGSVGAYTSTFRTDPVIARLSRETGALEWVHHIPMDGTVAASVVMGDGGILVGGVFSGNAVVGGALLDAGVAEKAAWFAKITP